MKLLLFFTLNIFIVFSLIIIFYFYKKENIFNEINIKLLLI